MKPDLKVKLIIGKKQNHSIERATNLYEYVRFASNKRTFVTMLMNWTTEDVFVFDKTDLKS